MSILQTAQWPLKLIQERLKRPYDVISVYEHSPAQSFGIKPGWKLIQVDRGDVPLDSAISNARINGMQQMVFLPDANSCEVRILEHDLWPCGLNLVPAIGDDVINDILNNEASYQDIDEIWSRGNWKDFSKLKDACLFASLPLILRLPHGLIPFWHSALRKVLGPKTLFKLATMSLPEHKQPVFNTAWQRRFLALSCLADGQLEDAEIALAASEATFAKCEIAMTSYFHVLPFFIRALIHYNSGNIPEAKAQIERASGLNQSRTVLDAHSSIHRKSPLIKWSPHIQKPFPVAYDLPRYDCFGVFNAPEKRCALRPSLEAMEPGQFLVVILLAGYRSNGPMQQEVRGLRSLYNAFPETFAAVHVITSNHDGSGGWKHSNKAEDDFAKTDLDYQIGFDENDDIARGVEIQWAPSVYILDHRGIVLSVESLADERGFWEAMDRRSDPEFQAEVAQSHI